MVAPTEAASPLAVGESDIAPEVVERERQVYLEQVRNEGKPENIQEKIVEGKLRRFFEESTLLKQPFVKNPDQTITRLVLDVGKEVGDTLAIRRFVRLQLGEGLSKKTADLAAEVAAATSGK